MNLCTAKLTLLLVWTVIFSPVQWAAAQLLQEDLPPSAQSINVENSVGKFVPLDLVFNDERGTAVSLGKYFKQGKPIVMTLNYSDCPGLCVAQLDLLTQTLRDLAGLKLGQDFEILTVSIDPLESSDKAARTKAKYTGLLSDSQAAEGWHFLTGKQTAISQLADAVGFRYTYDKVNKRYNHAAATYFLSSDGRVCRYLLSLGAEPQQFQLAVSEAAQGKLMRTFADAIIQLCYMYDPDANRYTASARRMLAFGGGAFVLLLLGFTAPFWFSRRPRSDQASAAKAPDPQIEPRQLPPQAYNNPPADIPESNEALK